MACRALDGLLRRMACPSPPTLTHPSIDPASPQAGVFFHRAVSVDASPDPDALGQARIGLDMALSVSDTAIPKPPRAFELF